MHSENSLSLEEKLDLSSWGLPDYILQKYISRGIRKMFPWQVECLTSNNVLNGGNLVYSAPTSAGKTLVAEILALQTVLERKKKVIIILPFVSVVREKVFYFQDILSGSGIRVEGFMGSYNPPGGFRAVHVAICTIEKANNLINRLLEERNFAEIGCVIVDELHLLGDPQRGYLLELLLTKLKYIRCKGLSCNIQIVGMSATLPNLDILANWLDATLYHTEFRPIPLIEYLKIGHSVYKTPHLRESHELKPYINIKNDSDDVIFLCLDTILKGYSALVFCPAKNWCESLAVQIASEIKRIGCSNDDAGQSLRSQLNSEGISNILELLKKCPVGLEKELGKSVSFGVGYHHAGLTLDERDIVEGGFRQSIVRVLVATSTLSSGVNLPARRVIIRSPSFQGRCMDILTYKQMIGRAGRMGKDTAGESYLICNEEDKHFGRQLVTSELPAVESCLGHGDLSKSLKRALLEVTASGIVETTEELEQYTRCTLLAASSTDATLTKAIASCRDYLERNEFIKVSPGGGVAPSPLAEACLSASFPPDQALHLLKELHKARQCFVLDSDLHSIYEVTPYSICDYWSVEWMRVFSIWDSLPSHLQKIGELVGVEDRFLIRAMRSALNLNIPENVYKLSIHKRFYTALALQDLINECPLNEVAKKFGCNKGMLQSLQQSASTFAAMVTNFCRKLGWNGLEVILAQLARRIQFGVQKDLLDLLRLDCMSAQLARALHNAGITTLSELASTNFTTLQNAITKATPFQSDIIEESKDRKTVYLPGRPGLSAVEVADIFIHQARSFLLKEMGVKSAEWTEDAAVPHDSLYEHSTINIESSRHNLSKKSISLNKQNTSGSADQGDVTSICSPPKNMSPSVAEIKTETVEQKFEVFSEKIKVSFGPSDDTEVLDPSKIAGKNDSPQKISQSLYKNTSSLHVNKASEDLFDPIEDNKLFNNLGNSQTFEQYIVPETEPINETLRKNVLIQTVLNKTDDHNNQLIDKSRNSKVSTWLKDIDVMENGKIDCHDSNIYKMENTFEFFDISKKCVSSKGSPMNNIVKHSTPLGTPKVGEDVNISNNDMFSDSPQFRNSPLSAKPPTQRHLELDPNWGGDSLLEVSLSHDLSNAPTNNVESGKKRKLSDTKDDVLVPTGKKIKLSTEFRRFKSSPNLGFNKLGNDNDFFNDSFQFDTVQMENAVNDNSCYNSSNKKIQIENFYQLNKPYNSSPDMGNADLKGKSSLACKKLDEKSCENPRKEECSVRGEEVAKNNSISNSMLIKAFEATFQCRSDLEHKGGGEDCHISDSEDLLLRSPEVGCNGKFDLLPSSSTLIKKSESVKDFSMNTPKKKSISSPVSSPAKYPPIGQDIVQMYKSPSRAKNRSLSLRSSSYSPQNSRQNNKITKKVSSGSNTGSTRPPDVSGKIRDFKKQLDLNKEAAFYCDIKKIDESNTIGGKIVRRSITNENKLCDYQYKYGQEVLIGAYFYCGKKVYHLDMTTSAIEQDELLKYLLTESRIKLYGVNVKDQLRVLYGSCNYKIRCKFYDVAVADWILNPGERSRSIKELVCEHLSATSSESLIIKKEACDNSDHVVLLWELQKELTKKLKQLNIYNIFIDVEMPIQRCLLSLEMGGMGFCHQTASGMWSSVIELMGRLEIRAFSLAKRKFNMSSNMDLNKIKAELKMHPDEEAEHPLLATVQNWRKLSSLKSRNLGQLLCTTSERCFSKCSTNTVTGRIMMFEPNLQHVPKDFTVDGHLFSLRSAFIARPGNVLVSADYAQLELRILAHFCQDPILVPLLRKNCDVFRSIAAEWNNMAVEKVSDELRNQVKQLCYGIIYGMGDRALGEAMGKSAADAAMLAATFRRSFPKMGAFVSRCIEECRERGYITTLAGRQRRLPEINSPTAHLRAQAERQAVNSTIQGTASDITKKAMVEIEEKLNCSLPNRCSVLSEGSASHLVLQLHDELIYEVEEKQMSIFVDVLRNAMENSTFLSVPLPIVIKSGQSWGKLKVLL